MLCYFLSIILHNKNSLKIFKEDLGDLWYKLKENYIFTSLCLYS